MRHARRGLTAESIHHDQEFHELLGRGTRNKVLVALIRSLIKSQIDDWISSLHTPGRMEKTINEHGMILDAVKAGDGEAAMAHMAAHLSNAIRDIEASATRRPARRSPKEVT